MVHNFNNKKNFQVTMRNVEVMHLVYIQNASQETFTGNSFWRKKTPLLLKTHQLPVWASLVLKLYSPPLTC